MIPKKIEQINESDIKELIQNSVREGKTIEYKQELPGDSDSDKKEFLADISSFANTVGGDLVIGLEEKEGAPTQPSKLKIENIDREISRLENIARDGISPRIVFNIRSLELEGGNILIFRIKQSWTKPHRVIFKGHDKFYARNSNGKYPMDIYELRSAFLAKSITEKIMDFRRERISNLVINETPIPFTEGAKIVLHIVPLESFTSGEVISPDILNNLSSNVRNFKPMRSSGYSYRNNLEGVLSYSKVGDEPAHSYNQVFRNGVIEAVDSSMLSYRENKILPGAYEGVIIEYARKYLDLLREIGMNVPFYLFLSFLGVKGYTMGFDGYSSYIDDDNYPIPKDNLVLPEVVVEEFDQDIKALMKSTFDLVWNACGAKESLWYLSQERRGN